MATVQIKLTLSVVCLLLASSGLAAQETQGTCPSFPKTSSGLLAPTHCPLAPGLTQHPTWEVKLTPHAGRGVFATTAIPKGTTLLTERPLFSVEPPAIVPGKGYDITAMTHDVFGRFNKLSAADQEEFLSCHEQRLAGDRDDEAGKVMAILRSNAYTLVGEEGRTRVGIYPKVALINHSCRPNVLNADDHGTRRIVAARDIEAGEEILTTYIPLLSDTPTRNHRLAQYGFHCSCSSCQTGASDAARVQAGRDLRELEDALASSHHSREESLLPKAEALAEYVDAQGFADYLEKTSRLALAYATRERNEVGREKWEQRNRKHVEAGREK